MREPQRAIAAALTGALAILASCGIADDPMGPSFPPAPIPPLEPPSTPPPQPPESPPPPPNIVGSLRLTGTTTGAFVGLKVPLGVVAHNEQGQPMSSDQAVVTSSDLAVAIVSRLDLTTISDNLGRNRYQLLTAYISMVGTGTAIIRASLQGVRDSVVIAVRALPPPTTALAVDSFTVVEFRGCAGCNFLGYAPLLRLRETTGTSYADVIAVQFNLPTRSTGWCTGEMRFASGQAAHVNGVDPYPYFNTMVIYHGTPLPEGPATARVIVREATGAWGLVEATTTIKRAVTNPSFPPWPVDFWICAGGDAGT